MALQREILAKIFSTLAVQTNGLGCSLLMVMNSLMVAINSGTLVKTPRRMRLSVSSRNQRSTRLSHQAEVGVKCRWKRGCWANQRDAAVGQTISRQQNNPRTDHHALRRGPRLEPALQRPPGLITHLQSLWRIPHHPLPTPPITNIGKFHQISLPLATGFLPTRL